MCFPQKIFKKGQQKGGWKGKKRTRFGFDVGIRPERFFLEKIFSCSWIGCSSRYMGFSCFVRCYIEIIYFLGGEGRFSMISNCRLQKEKKGVGYIVEVLTQEWKLRLVILYYKTVFLFLMKAYYINILNKMILLNKYLIKTCFFV